MSHEFIKTLKESMKCLYGNFITALQSLSILQDRNLNSNRMLISGMKRHKIDDRPHQKYLDLEWLDQK